MISVLFIVARQWYIDVVELPALLQISQQDVSLLVTDAKLGEVMA